MTHIEIGRIAGIAIYLDMMFVLVLLLFTYPYFTSGNTQMMSAGFIIVIGLLLSILLHERDMPSPDGCSTRVRTSI